MGTSTMFFWIYFVAFFSGHALNIDVNKHFYENNKNIPVSRTSSPQGTNVSTFYNVIAQDGADPWVYKHTDGWYYMTRTTGVDVRIWRSRSLTSIDAGDTIAAWTSSGSGPACAGFWAPELHYLQSSWYIYFTATTCDGKVENHRMFAIENTNADPFNGSFTWKGQLVDSTNKYAIDGTIFEHPSGQLYFIWSGCQGDVVGEQLLYIAQLSNPWTISSERVEISRPTYNWEASGGGPGINEGPEVTVRNGVIVLVYSAAGSSTDQYCLGLITASTSSDPMNPVSWTKRAEPIFRSGNNVVAPGHHSFTKSPDDQEDWIVYHSARYSGSGWVRQVRTQKFTWNADSTPNLGQPVDRNIPIQIPSGDQIRTRYEAEAAVLLNNPRAVAESTASNTTKVGFIDYSNSTVIFTIQCTRSGTYVIVIRNGNGSAGNVLSTHLLAINNGTQTEIPIVYGEWDMWGATMIRANLTEGANTITFKKGANYAELDELDIFLDA